MVSAATYAVGPNARWSLSARKSIAIDAGS
jgi:hypothetical protein